jgi:alpha-L-fucosidase 2
MGHGPIVGDERSIVLDRPAEMFQEAFVLGNGSLGASVYGAAGVETFDLNLDTVWSGGPRPEADVSETPGMLLTELRSAIAASEHDRADRLARAIQGEDWTESYQPLGRLRWRWGTSEATDQYQRSLDLAHAVARVETATGAMEAYASAPDGVLVAEAEGPGEVPIELGFESPHPGVEVRSWEQEGITWLVATGRAPSKALPNYVEAENPVEYDREAPGADGTVATGMGWAVAAALEGRRLIISASSGFRGCGERPSADFPTLAAEAAAPVRAALAESSVELRRRHVQDYRALFDRVRLDLAPSGDPRATAAQRYFDFGRYLLIASSRPTTQAANLQGIWNVDVRPGWSANYTTNINVEMNYWGAEVTGLPELHEPLFDLARDLAEAGRATAANVYRAAGAAVHHNTDLWRFTEAVHGDPQWANWQTGLAWIATHLGDHLDYRWDEDFARSTAAPVVRAAAEFLLDQLVEDRDGHLVISPSTSPEHRFRDGEELGTVTAGATIDQELTAQTFDRLVALADRLGDDEGDLPKRCREARARLRLPAIDDAGRLGEWAPSLQPSELDHRHLSHLYGAFPGFRITETATPAEFEAVKRALAHRLEHGSGYTGWSQAWVLCLAARLRDAALVERSIGTLVDGLSSDSLLDLHPLEGWPGDAIFQIDGNLGAIAGITEALVQSHDGALSLLPALPPSWKAGSVSGLRARGERTVDLAWSAGVLVSARVRTAVDGDLVIEMDEGLSFTVTGAIGDPIAPSPVPTRPPGRERHRWAVVAGGTYEIMVQPTRKVGNSMSSIDGKAA